MKIKRGDTITGLDGREDLTNEDLTKTDRVVAMAGIHPYMDLLDNGAHVIIGGRSSDCAIFARRLCGAAIQKLWPITWERYLSARLSAPNHMAARKQ